jgi:multidrug efflux system outer membrane protein
VQAGHQRPTKRTCSGASTGRRDAAALDAESRQALLQSTRLLVQAETAQAYLALRALDVERAIVRETVAAYADTLRLTQRRYQAGDVAELDVVRVENGSGRHEAEALALDRQRAALEHALAVLLGDAPSEFALDTSEWATALPAIPAGVPATVLARRPDVAAAQASLLAAQARVGVAQPRGSRAVLTGAGGFASSDLGDLLKWSARRGAWACCCRCRCSTAAGATRRLAEARAQLDANAASYRGQVLVAFREVEDQLSALRLLQEQAQVAGRAVTPRAARPRCRTRATATAWSASWNCWMRAAASCATGARRCRCARRSSRRRWA